MQEICVNYIISGKVQGVYFRGFVVNEAKRIGIKGRVRNLSSGNEVEVTACGPRELITEFERLLKKGSPASKVDHINKKIIEYENYDNFMSLPTK